MGAAARYGEQRRAGIQNWGCHPFDSGNHPRDHGRLVRKITPCGRRTLLESAHFCQGSRVDTGSPPPAPEELVAKIEFNLRKHEICSLVSSEMA